MAIEPVFESLLTKGEVKEISEKIKAECKTDRDCAEIKKVLSVSAKVFGLEKELTETGVKYGGKLVFYFCYLDEDGAVKKIECANEFVGSLKAEAISDKEVYLTVEPLKCEWDVSGATLILSATLEVKAEISGTIKLNALVGGEGLIVERKDAEYFKGYGIKRTTYPVEAEFEVGYQVLEVLSQRVEAIVSSVQAGVGCIIVDGEIFLSLLLLQNRENSDIIKEEKSVGFRLELDCEDAVPKMSAGAKIQVRSFKTDVKVEPEQQKSTINLSSVLELVGECFSKERISVVSDAFNEKENLTLIKEDFSCSCPLAQVVAPLKITGRSVQDEIPVSARITASYAEKITLTEINLIEEGVELIGVLSMKAFLKDGDGKVFTMNAETPFKEVLEIGVNQVPQVKFVVSKSGAKIVSNTELEIYAQAECVLQTTSCACAEIVADISTCGEKQVCDKAVSVYIAQKGESLWELAKRLNVCPESIIKNNIELQFPLSGEERIVVYRQI